MKLAASLLLAVTAFGGHAGAASDPTELLERVCRTSAGAKATPLIDSTRQRVECAPHTQLAGLPALHAAECERKAKAWRCDHTVLAVRAKFGNREVLLTPDGTTFEVALQIATFLGVTHPYTFNGRNLADMLQGHCLVSDRGPGAFAGARDFRLRCGDRGVLVTRACNSTPCRLFPAQFDDAE